MSRPFSQYIRVKHALGGSSEFRYTWAYMPVEKACRGLAKAIFGHVVNLDDLSIFVLEADTNTPFEFEWITFVASLNDGSLHHSFIGQDAEKGTSFVEVQCSEMVRGYSAVQLLLQLLCHIYVCTHMCDMFFTHVHARL